jgi:glycogen operon protein
MILRLAHHFKNQARNSPLSIHPTPGQPTPLGATVTADGVNFAIFSRHATRVWLMLFDNPGDGQPSHEFRWRSIAPATSGIFTYRACSTSVILTAWMAPTAEQGHRFNCYKPL